MHPQTAQDAVQNLRLLFTPELLRRNKYAQLKTWTENKVNVI